MAPKKKPRKSNPNSLPSIISIAMVLLMVGLFMLIALGAKRISDYMRENVVLDVYFTHEAEEEEMLKLKAELEKRPEIKQVSYIDKESGAKELSEYVGQDFIESLGFNPIPATLRIWLRSDHSSQSLMAALKLELARHDMVREVAYQSSQLEQVERNRETILLVISALSLVFLIIAITLINSTIRLDLYSKRFLIRSMQLVGATRWFIVRPFIWRSIVNGIIGWICASLMLSGIIYLAITWIPEVNSLLFLPELGLILAFIFGFGILLTTICSFFATGKYLKLKLEDLY